MQERPQRSSDRSRRSSSRSSGYDRRSSSQRGSRNRASEYYASSENRSGTRRRRDMGSTGTTRSNRPSVPLGSSRKNSQPIHGNDRRQRGTSRNRGRMNAPKGGYPLRNRTINFASHRGDSDVTFMIVMGVCIALLVVLVVILFSCAASCGSTEIDPTSNISDVLEGDLRTQVEQMVTSDYQRTYVAEHADQYPTDLIQLMVNEPASTSFVYNYPSASHSAQSYDESVSKGAAPLLYTWDPRWGYVDYAGNVLAITGSGPTALAMARMGLLGSTDQTPATLASYITQLGGATGETSMAASLFASSDASSTGTQPVDEDGDGYDDNTGDYIENADAQGTEGTEGASGDDIAKTLGLEVRTITAEPGYSVTDTVMDAVEEGASILIETAGGAFGTTPHWVVLVAQNSDGSVAVYDPTSVANSLHAWDPSTVINDSSTLVALSAPGGTDADDQTEPVDEDKDGYDDVTGVYLG